MQPGICKTSIIVPVHNTEQYLAACLDSILAQTQADFEAILVDDGSTDGSLAIERAYAERDSRIRVIEQPNLRQGAARNRGLAEARGEYVYFLDSDDVILPTLLETCYRACEDEGLDFATFDSAGFTDDPHIEQPELFDEICDRTGRIQPSVIDGVSFWSSYQASGMLPSVCWLQYFRRDFLIENDLRFAEGIYFEDNDWIARVYIAARRLKYLPLKLHRYRYRDKSTIHRVFSPALAKSCFDVHDILRGLAAELDEPATLRIIGDVGFVLNCRFKQFGEIEPTDELRSAVSQFVSRMESECQDVNVPEAVRNLDFNALVSLAEGICSWEDPPVLRNDSEFARIVCACMPAADDAPRIGIYGTGKACSAFLKVFDVSARTCYFLETHAESGRTFMGEPVYGIEEAANIEMDAIIVTSEKHAETLRENVRRFMGDDIPIHVVPRGILSLTNGDFDA